MAIAKNVAKGEKVIRFVVGVILLFLGFLLPGYWKPLSLIVGGLLLVTAFVGY